MKAIVVSPARRAVAVKEVPPPGRLDAAQARVRTLQLGLCGTDKEIARFEYGTPPDGEDDLILGHECLGEVAEVGPAVDRLAVGDLVVPRVRRPCARPECAPRVERRWPAASGRTGRRHGEAHRDAVA